MTPQEQLLLAFCRATWVDAQYVLASEAFDMGNEDAPWRLFPRHVHDAFAPEPHEGEVRYFFGASPAEEHAIDDEHAEALARAELGQMAALFDEPEVRRHFGPAHGRVLSYAPVPTGSNLRSSLDEVGCGWMPAEWILRVGRGPSLPRRGRIIAPNPVRLVNTRLEADAVDLSIALIHREALGMQGPGVTVLDEREDAEVHVHFGRGIATIASYAVVGRWLHVLGAQFALDQDGRALLVPIDALPAYLYLRALGAPLAPGEPPVSVRRYIDADIAPPVFELERAITDGTELGAPLSETRGHYLSAVLGRSI